MPGLIELYEKHAVLRDRFEILAFHDDSVKTLAEMDSRLRSVVKNVWKGKPLPFPILLDATPQTHRTNYAINFYPTTILMDPEGRVVNGHAEVLLERILEEAGGSGPTVAVTDDGRLIASADRNQVTLTPAAGAEQVFACGAGVRVTAVAFSQDGKTVAGASSDGLIRLWTSASGKPGAILRGPEGAVFAMAFSPDGRWLASGGFDTVRLWDLDRAQPVASLARHHWPSWAVAFSPDSRTLAAGGLSSVRLFDTGTGEERATFELGKALFCRALAFSPDGKILAASVGREVTTWDVVGRKNLARFEGHGSDVARLAFAGEGGALYSVSRGKRIKHWTASGGGAPEDSIAGPPPGIARWAERLPDNPEFLNDEAWSVVESAGGSQVEYDEALRQARLACQLSPGSTNYLQTLGAALYRARRYGEAIGTLRQVEVLPPRSAYDRTLPPAWLYLALAHHKNGDVAGAREALLRVRQGILDYREVPKSLRSELELELFGPGVRTIQDKLEGLFDQGLTAVAVLDAIDSDSGVDQSGRETARKLAPYVEAEEWIRKARDRVQLKTRILRELEETSAMSAAARPLAEGLARQLRESPSELNGASWKIVSQPGLVKAAYDLALEQAETAVRLRDEPAYLNTLGVAQYRAGRYKEALVTLGQSRARSAQDSNAPEDLAFIAMAQHQLGQADQARQTLDQLRQNKDALQPGSQGERFLREAEALINRAPAKTPAARE